MTDPDEQHQAVYDLPHIYDIAFSYRDIPREVDTLLHWASTLEGVPSPKRVLELAAGPGAHALEFARRDLEVTALDRSKAMCDYARARAGEWQLPLDVVCGDMCDFRVRMPCELAVSMLDSVAHITDLDRMVSHLEAVRDALRPGGIYVIEMAHPGDFLSVRARTVTRWVQRRGSTEVRIAWGADDDPFDPTTQRGSATVLMRITEPDGMRTVVDQVGYRRWTATEVDAAARLAGLEVVRWFGALDPKVPFSNEAGAWRMVPVLQRR